GPGCAGVGGQTGLSYGRCSLQCSPWNRGRRFPSRKCLTSSCCCRLIGLTQMARQLEFQVPVTYKHGGRRPGVGRPRTGRRGGVPHTARPFHDRHQPEHVTWRVVPGLPSLRGRALAGAIGRTFRSITKSHSRRRTGFRVVTFSIQPNHLHLIVEAASKITLAAGLRGLGIWIARRVNAVLGRKGRVIDDRYHARPLTTPREMRNALVYVLTSASHCTSFGGFSESVAFPRTHSSLWDLVRSLDARSGCREYAVPDSPQARAASQTIDVELRDGVGVPKNLRS